MLRNLKRLMPAAPVLATILTAQGCYMEVDEADAPADDGATHVAFPAQAFPVAGAQACSATGPAPGQGQSQCWQTPDYRWRGSCRDQSCRPVKVYVHYMLGEDLGAGRVAHVEAFDNEHFQGAPAGTVRMADFAARSGSWRDAEIYLEPGEYYLRAYLSTADDTVVPYTLGDMQLVGEQPVGVHGALSGAQMVRVPPRDQAEYQDPVHIYLDKLFQKPGSQPATRAFLRVELRTGEGVTVPDGRQIRVRLHRSADFAAAPEHELMLPSESLLVQGRVGRAEFVSPDLPEGDFIVSAYLDADGDAHADADEAAAVHMVHQQPALVQIRKDRTATVALELKIESRP